MFDVWQQESKTSVNDDDDAEGLDLICFSKVDFNGSAAVTRRGFGSVDT